jgi:urease accessory protein
MIAPLPAAHHAPRAGEGVLAFERSGARTIVTTARAQNPLKLLTPRNHGHASWVITATFGGGLVDGDAIALDIDVGAHASALLGTQASTKVYRCPTSACRQELSVRVAEHALFVAIPDPVACFAGGRYEQRVRVALAGSASLVLVDAFTAGRSARGERWDFLRYASRTEIARDGAPLLVDAVMLDPAHGDLHARMGRFDAMASLAIAGPAVHALREHALATSAPPQRGAPLVRSASAVGDDAVIVRIAGASIEAVTNAVRAELAGLAAILGDDPFARKW